jgi:CheY-like chemotaxis protein
VTERRPVVIAVDDDPLVLATIVMQLRRAGFETLEAHDGKEALRLCRVALPDVAIIDYAMPGMSGIALARELRGLGSVRCVLLTGSDDPQTAAMAAGAGAVACLVKPVDTARLGELLRRVLDSPST